MDPINNTVGIYYHEKSYLRVSNNKWTLLVYRDLKPVKDALDNNNKIMDGINDLLEDDNPRMNLFKPQIKTHFSLLTQIANSLGLKYTEAFEDTAKRYKRGLINGLGSIFKSITGNLDSSDGEYYTECINKISKDEFELEKLMKNQISVTTSVIKNFNATIQKLQIDEETFNEDLVKIRSTLYNISSDMGFFQAQLKFLELCETLTESYTFLQSELNDVLNAITFARLKIMHTSIITPKDLIISLEQISKTLTKDNIPLPIAYTNVAKYFNIIELSAFQSDSKIIFVLKIPLIEPENYVLYRLFPIPIIENRTGLHHVILANQKFIARDDDSMLYVAFDNLNLCKELNTYTQICSGVLPLPIDGSSICEAQLLRSSFQLPKVCHTTLIFATGYNVQELKTNSWLIMTCEQVPVTIKCINRDVVSKIVNTNSILKLQPECSAFIGSTRVRSKLLVSDEKNITYRNHPVVIPFQCCDNLPTKVYLPDLKPIKLSKIDTEELGIAQHKLDQYSEELDRMMKQPFVNKHISWFTYFTIAIVILLVTLYILHKCRRKTNRISITAGPGNPPPPPDRKGIPIFRRFLSPRRRPSVREQNQDFIELQ